MPKLTAFESVTLDGYFTDKKSEIGWAHSAPKDPEFDKFVAGNAQGGGALLFGRKTYDMMVQFWPTPMAKQQMPEVADGMNAMPKFVFSKSMKKADWNNTTVISGDIAAEARKLKESAGLNITILGSGTIVSALTQAGLIDEYQLVVIPVAIGEGRTLFEDVKNKVDLKLKSSRQFPSGRVFLTYER